MKNIKSNDDIFLLSSYNYELPEELIAQSPSEKRDMSRLLVMDRKSGELSHKLFCDVIDYLNEGDALIINNSKVIPARLFGKRRIKDTSGKITDTLGDTVIEVFLLERKTDKKWEVLMKPARKAPVGTIIEIGDGKLKATVCEILPDGNRIVEFEYNGEFFAILDEIGEMPLPPYIHERSAEKGRYQTVYAKHEGSSAAPTAGLHFTNELLEKIKAKGVKIIPVTLHVGLGTFRPVHEDNIKNHKMHSEFYTISEESANTFNEVKRNGGRIFCVGTTSCRTIESNADENGLLSAKSDNTSIFIYPGYKFKAVDCLITNFHLPQSTLIMLISAFVGREEVLDMYNVAVENKYRFFSFGDACLFL